MELDFNTTPDNFNKALVLMTQSTYVLFALGCLSILGYYIFKREYYISNTVAMYSLSITLFFWKKGITEYNIYLLIPMGISLIIFMIFASITLYIFVNEHNPKIKWKIRDFDDE